MQQFATPRLISHKTRRKWAEFTSTLRLASARLGAPELRDVQASRVSVRPELLRPPDPPAGTSGASTWDQVGDMSHRHTVAEAVGMPVFSATPGAHDEFRATATRMASCLTAFRGNQPETSTGPSHIAHDQMRLLGIGATSTLLPAELKSELLRASPAPSTARRFIRRHTEASYTRRCYCGRSP